MRDFLPNPRFCHPMKLHELKPNTGAKKSATRRGRGNGSKKGTYSGRGMKGQNSRSGGCVRLGFEGGQSTLLQRMPKRRGFTNPNRISFAAVNLDRLEEKFNANDTVTLETLKEKNLIRQNAPMAKILARGEISKKLTVQGLYVSETAKKKIEKADGKIEDEQIKEKKVASKQAGKSASKKGKQAPKEEEKKPEKDENPKEASTSEKK